MSQFETSAGIDSLTGKLNSRERIDLHWQYPPLFGPMTPFLLH
jgi:hypothetical protein